MEQLKAMKQCLEGCVQGQVFDLKNADYHELGAAVDMIKDLCEAIYYCTITEAMEEKEEGKETHYYTHTLPYLDYGRDMDRTYGRMYYNGNGGSTSSSGGTMNYTEHPMTRLDMRDSREGRSPMSRRMYMETKQMHQPKEIKMKELEKYLQELGQDITEMIVDASPEEKSLMQQKLTGLVQKL